LSCSCLLTAHHEHGGDGQHRSARQEDRGGVVAVGHRSGVNDPGYEPSEADHRQHRFSRSGRGATMKDHGGTERGGYPKIPAGP
jgi:hypothetical protein